MTREKEITKEAKKFAKEIDDWEIAEDVQDAFEQGALWADKHPRWISVEDELPKENGRYLFYHTITGVQSSYYYNDLTLDKAVTHWMPLPSIEGIRGNQGKIPTNRIK
mgnify:CR=1 FL=1